MKAVIIGNGSISNYNYIRSLIDDGDFIICADGGVRHALKMGINVNVLIGDFDSVNADVQGAAEVIEYPVRKDFTDGELCVRYAAEHGFSEVLLLGMTGTRLDHTINNILLLLQCKSGCLIDEYNEIYSVRDELIIKGKKGKTLSIIPVFGDMEGVTAEGLEYPLNDEALCFGITRGNSNVVTEDECVIRVKKGIGIVIIGNGE